MARANGPRTSRHTIKGVQIDKGHTAFDELVWVNQQNVTSGVINSDSAT